MNIRADTVIAGRPARDVVPFLDQVTAFNFETTAEWFDIELKEAALFLHALAAAGILEPADCDRFTRTPKGDDLAAARLVSLAIV